MQDHTENLTKENDRYFEQSGFLERLDLCFDRIDRIPSDSFGEAAFQDYFVKMALFLISMKETFHFVEGGGLKAASLEELARRNHALYEDILPEHYEKSYANPAYAVSRLGEALGSALSFLYAELRSLIGFVHEGRLEELVIRSELFLEVYTAFVYAWEEERRLPDREQIRQILYWFVNDYSDVAAERRIRELLISEGNFALRILQDADLSDVRYLYAYGEYVGENELAMARFLAKLPDEELNRMADTYTEGYRRGFEVCRIDLSRKETVELRYQLGFERMMRRALQNFEAMGLKATVHRAAASILYHPSLVKNGYYGGTPNRQYAFDHKDDKALFLDRNYVKRNLEVTRTAFEQYKKEARGYAGPAVVETFGEKDFAPVNKPESLRMSEEQNRLWVEYRTQAGEQQRNYIIEEERSFTIIAFPIPEIGERFPEIFSDIIRINTLDSRLYQRIQQSLIDVLDTGEYCVIKGKGDNRTDLRVNLYRMQDPDQETIFENCVADVNIPVGEVFTSPKLEGTQGVLHVSRVYLNGLEYRDLEITFQDGKVKDYHCSNFQKKEENRAFIKENILFFHDTLPMGEFAIGTNTTAYAVAKKYGIEGKLPILIAEKMGPHFALGDTCYSHSEEVKVYNPDGKEIVAKDNEISILRGIKPEKAYFNCHTDITLPYEELGELNVVRPDGETVPIIKDGRFVLPGTEELNMPLALK
ncbi:MAG: aminopeptidase [Candidatus Gastranaerophilales bacterium]|nr:aminopeptidase [Candidatus Gastranaerophilales bacterium]